MKFKFLFNYITSPIISLQIQHFVLISAWKRKDILKKFTPEDLDRPLSKVKERQIRRILLQVAEFAKQKGTSIPRENMALVFNQRWEFTDGGFHVLYYQDRPDSPEPFCGTRVSYNKGVLLEAFYWLVKSSPERIEVRVFQPGKWEERIITRAPKKRS